MLAYNSMPLKNIRIILLFFVAAFVLISGFRHEVGGDWYSYLTILDNASKLNFDDVIHAREPLYILLNWISGNSLGGIYFINSLCSIFLGFGLLKFSVRQQFPLIVMLVAFPYLLLVVGMGYTRQAAAMGFVLLALSQFDEDSSIKYVFFIFVASLFHFSAILLLPFVIFKLRQFKFYILCGLLLVFLFMVVWPYFEIYIDLYFLSISHVSLGVLPRLILCFIPSVLYLIFYRKFQISIRAKWLWFAFSMVSILLFFTYLAFPVLSTPIDRVALYLIPLQLFVYSNLPMALCSYKINPSLTILVISFFYSFVFFAWIFFSHYVEYWIPYKFFPFVLIFG